MSQVRTKTIFQIKLSPLHSSLYPFLINPNFTSFWCTPHIQLFPNVKLIGNCLLHNRGKGKDIFPCIWSHHIWCPFQTCFFLVSCGSFNNFPTFICQKSVPKLDFGPLQASWFNASFMCISTFKRIITIEFYMPLCIPFGKGSCIFFLCGPYDNKLGRKIYCWRLFQRLCWVWTL